ncbi:hypothetical protein K450DRAFT_231759 [Umbelopsis ramanniana AG]|uniref:XPG N-terminal domain-containing protein n=1 Tax=Umbelopsis ramanniana AG TaxID=1314678 RepID=A0AAD5EDW9_UMBRA|nr:uncharacterized protein K450DRAFT_231759 [Umbelopsis ramanniana AG]KAI8581532.1 hypothetical protein K450DRAFT_231759 [Umbelopsis ramanniana AG]
MGVKNLWDILAPVARPVQLDSLRQRKLAIDASIWLYHFLKAVRDKEGNALKNAHIVGFFRRICKLLYYNIRPVFVFDGGAPALKRLTIERSDGNVDQREQKILRKLQKRYLKPS